MKKKSKKKAPAKQVEVKRTDRAEQLPDSEKQGQWGGIPDRNLKKNLGC